MFETPKDERMKKAQQRADRICKKLGYEQALSFKFERPTPFVTSKLCTLSDEGSFYLSDETSKAHSVPGGNMEAVFASIARITFARVFSNLDCTPKESQ